MEQPEGLVYRAAGEADIDRMADLFIESVSDLYRRHGQQRSAPNKTFVLNNYAHVLRTGGFRVAEVDGELLAHAGMILRDNLWFLSAFWARPGRQGQGIGGPLLRQVMDEGAAAGADTFFVWSSVDTRALSSYMKLGMLPGYPIFFMETPAQDWQPPAPIPGYQSATLEPEFAMQLDAQVRGTRRPQDHAYFSEGMHMQGRVVRWHGEPVGYYYLGAGGVVPAAWSNPIHAAGLMALALGEAAELGGIIRVNVPGHSHAALNFVLSVGLRLTAYAHLLLSRPFGLLEQYLPSGPGVY